MSSVTYKTGADNEKKSKAKGRLRFAIHTLGCKVNSYESDRMAGCLIDAGFEPVDFEDKADIYIVNTCSVTNIADRKSRQILHRAKKMNPDAVIVAAGCYVQSREQDEILSDGVDVLIGNEDKDRIAGILTEYFKNIRLSEADNPECQDYVLQQLPASEHTRAYIKIQDGCNQFCTYCIIPYVRGRIKSRDLKEIVDEAKNLAKAGFREVVLTGIHVSSYGKDLAVDEVSSKHKDYLQYKIDGKLTLLSVIKAVHEVEGIDRIRLSSLEMGIITPQLAGELAALPKLCPHFHLSLQSGCADTLKRMNRHYTPEEYAASVKYLRDAFYEKRGAYPAITTDVITGFPGESDEDFEQSRSFVESIGFFETHIFKYSKRQGTIAAKMKGQLTDRVKAQRSSVLIAMNEKKRAEYIEGIIGEKAYMPSLLIEEETVIEGQKLQVGYTAEYIRCGVKSDEDLRGKILIGHIALSDIFENGRQICIMDEFEVK
ncbi:MAG: tRNA (N(6)-L-threonylcarbamoyladenosine(37)-C(2))-methylthiotransferase MtaB [Lachnospiraceae bacterium]|nr:tRNA (N(6)-L-threonylcarbamoyladenosine(37)-C(2))-methylthiotransferase MtaB [Lachnospiraceae bacterium]